MERPWLVPKVSAESRKSALEEALKAAGWKSGRWPRWVPSFIAKRSMAIPVLKRVLLTPEANWTTLAHEAEHALRSSKHRWLWSLRYVGGVVFPLSLLSGIWQPYLLLILGPLVLPVWLWSERFRRDEEVAAFAVSAIARVLHVGGDPEPEILAQQSRIDALHSYKWPYLVGGAPEKLHLDIAASAQALWGEQDA